MTGFDVRDPDGTTYVSAADAEAHVRATLDRPDQVHVIAPETLRALLDEIRGLRQSARRRPRRRRERAVSGIHGLDNRLAVDWAPILTAADDLTGDGDATALVGALGRLLAAIPDEVLERHLATRPAVGYADAQGRPVGGQITLTSIGAGYAGCPVGECGHPAASHEPDDHSPDGAPLRPICCAGDCRCGDEWRNA